MKFRFKLSCGHWTPVLDERMAAVVRSVQTYRCAKCDPEVNPPIRVVRERQLKDSAVVQYQTRRVAGGPGRREAVELRTATQQRDVAARHWKIG